MPKDPNDDRKGDISRQEPLPMPRLSRTSSPSEPAQVIARSRLPLNTGLAGSRWASNQIPIVSGGQPPLNPGLSGSRWAGDEVPMVASGHQLLNASLAGSRRAGDQIPIVSGGQPPLNTGLAGSRWAGDEVPIVAGGQPPLNTSLKASRLADGHLRSIPTRLESKMFKEANIQEKETLTPSPTPIPQDAAVPQHLSMAPANDGLPTLIVNANIQQDDNIGIVTGEDTPITRYLFLCFAQIYIGALLTCCSPLTTQVRNEVDGDIVLQDLDDLEVVSQINEILERERDGAKELPMVVSDINVSRLSDGD
jgi:hypothetical protein